MLEPRVADLLVLLLLLVAFPLLAYILLEKWSEAAKRNERVSLLAEQAAEEARKAESMTISTLSPKTLKRSGVLQCARCLAPATTRCSKCKSTRYCSGGCQILHCRQIHMYECQDIEITSFTSSPTPSLGGELRPDSIIPDKGSHSVLSAEKSSFLEKVSPDVNHIAFTGDPTYYSSASSETQFMEVQFSDIKQSYKFRKDEFRIQDGRKFSADNSNRRNPSTSPRQKSRKSNESLEKPPQKTHNSSAAIERGRSSSRNQVDEEHQCSMPGEPKIKGSNYRITKEKDILETEINKLLNNGKQLASKLLTSTKMSTDKASVKLGITAKGYLDSLAGDLLKPTKSTLKGSGEQSSSVTDKLRDSQEKSKESIGCGNMGNMEIMGQKNSTILPSSDGSPTIADKKKKNKMLFPYGEFVRLFKNNNLNLFPRGLLNCGNSCYANAVLQCLIYTKPLIVYLLESLHSRSCS